MSIKPTYEALEKQVEALQHALDSRERTEEALKSEKSWSDAIIRAAPNIIVGLGEDSRILVFNRFAERLTGYAAREVLGKEWIEIFIPPDMRKSIYAVWDQIVTQGLVQHHFENPILTQTGEARLISWNNTVLKEQGKFKMVLSIGEDITERKQAEDALRRSEHQFRELFDSITDLIYTQDMEGRFLSVNPAMHALFGYETTEFIGRTGADFMKADLKPMYFSQYLEGIKRQGHFEGVSAYYKKDGGKIYIEFRSKLVLPEHGKPYISGIGRDVTERILAERERNQSEKERERLQAQLIQAQKIESVGRLAGGVAHDFNNMLGVILGRTELMLMEMAPDDPRCKDLEEIQKVAKRSADLTRQLLAFARKQTITPKVLDLNATVEGMLKMLRRLIGEDIDLTWKPDAHLWPVKMDPAQIDQILANLCVNARDAISGVGNVTIETRNVLLDEAYCVHRAECVPGAYVLLAVSDDGCGMDKEALKSLFEPFFTTKEVGEGTGLGLATVYGIIKQNDGHIHVYSEPGKGTTFKMYLPRHAGNGVAETLPESGAIPMGHGETILLVEDDAAILTMGQAMLERLGYTVQSAGTPVEALDIVVAYKENMHLLMTDIVMPQMSGKELADRVQTRLPGIKVLFMSGYTADVIAQRGILDGEVHFIQKPFSMKDLADRVREALDTGISRPGG